MELADMELADMELAKHGTNQHGQADLEGVKAELAEMYLTKQDEIELN